MKKILLLALIGVISLTGTLSAKDNFKVATSIYVGWLPWYYAADNGVLEKNAKANGISIKLDKINTYIESVNLYTAGNYDAVTITSMDTLSIPAVSGIKSKALIIGDYSNGNDGIISKKSSDILSLKGQKFYLEEFSVSHYLLVRVLNNAGMKERDIKLVHTSENDLLTIFMTDSNAANIVTWNPWLMQAMNDPKSKSVATSAEIPNEILDLLIVNEKTSDPRFEKALRDTWTEILDMVMNPANPKHKDILSYMASESQASVAEIKKQLETTSFFTAEKEASFRTSYLLKNSMTNVTNFLFDHGLYTNLNSVDDIGIKTGNTVIGSDKNILLSF